MTPKPTVSLRTIAPGRPPLLQANHRPHQPKAAALPEITTGPNGSPEPIVFLAIDTLRRHPTDIIFVNAEDGTPESFIHAT